MDNEQTLWERFTAGVQSTTDQMQIEVTKGFAEGVLSPLTDAVKQVTSAVSGVGQTQSDVANISSFTDSLKKYIWLVPVVIILLMIAAKHIFKKKGGR